MAELFLVFGTQGAGKTAVLKGVRSAKTVSIGTEMHKAYSSRFGIGERDEMRKKQLTTYAETVKIRNAILRKLAGAPGVVALDTHASVKVGDGYIVGLSTRDLATLSGKTKAIIYVDSSNKEILARREKDRGKRKRENDTEEELNRHRNINMNFVALFSMQLEVPIFVVENREGRLGNTQKRIDAIIKSLK